MWGSLKLAPIIHVTIDLHCMGENLAIPLNISAKVVGLGETCPAKFLAVCYTYTCTI